MVRIALFCSTNIVLISPCALIATLGRHVNGRVIGPPHTAHQGSYIKRDYTSCDVKLAMMKFCMSASDHARASQKYGSRLSLEIEVYGLRIGTFIFGAQRVGRLQERQKFAHERSVDDADFASNSTAVVPFAILSALY
ncbi:hypothetical protein EVAR_63465_1 [Eumeta japonica]|uniref:Secreted protein n=1 Tax=Eumeta variegata TaxID=151549 RepID=A0A4C1YD54_EUMVA|nr:hypothetical protein EVAR_63465_1 [Eumeta japonica]